MKLLSVHHVFTNVSQIQNWFSDVAQLQNVTIEERVTVLEAEMTGVLSEIVELNFDVDFLFTEQALQDQQIFSLYEETDELEGRVDGAGKFSEMLIMLCGQMKLWFDESIIFCL